ncbi:MAG: type II toxin-antitoxin system HicA family toxin [Bryobacteraceae bacterium]
MYDIISERFGVSQECPALWRRKIEEADLQTVSSHGKGSHGTLYVGANGRTTVQYLKREIPTGTLRAMIEQLKLEAKDFGLS